MDSVSCHSPEGQRVLRGFLDDDGRLHTIPSKRSKQLVVLDWLVQDFEPGRRYPEAEVVEVLTRRHPDHAALRRYLVIEGLLSREDAVYWRTGGSVADADG